MKNKKKKIDRTKLINKIVAITLMVIMIAAFIIPLILM